MNFIKFIINLVGNVKKNNSFGQFLLFLVLLSFLMIIGTLTLIKVAIPFTYIAL